ncbi:MAG: hypothetical protein H0X24_02205 [Ktedonobacterales bacterium]|nr:hypothetical protein [Ktedonobacterales bacterium]
MMHHRHTPVLFLLGTFLLLVVTGCGSGTGTTFGVSPTATSSAVVPTATLSPPDCQPDPHGIYSSPYISTLQFDALPAPPLTKSGILDGSTHDGILQGGEMYLCSAGTTALLDAYFQHTLPTLGYSNTAVPSPLASTCHTTTHTSSTVWWKANKTFFWNATGAAGSSGVFWLYGFCAIVSSSSTPTPPPSSATCSSAFSGTFDAPPLDSRWQQFPASGGSIVVDSTAHFVGISSPAHTDLSGSTLTASRILQPIGGNFTVNTNVIGIRANIQPGTYQGGGLLIWQDTHTYARLEVASFDGQTWGVEFDVTDHGISHRVTLATNVSVDDPVLSKLTLQVQRTGNTLSASLRPPMSSHYTPVGSYTLSAPLTNPQVGLDVVNTTSGTTEAFGFEWFIVHCP